jgi:3-keto steroid reductase
VRLSVHLCSSCAHHGLFRGVGFGICERLLSQLSSPTPSDANLQLYPPVNSSSVKPLPPYQGLTLILACRNLERAEAARKELYQRADVEVAKRRGKAGDNGHADRFRANLHIELQYIDLADLKTVFKAADELSNKYVMNILACLFVGPIDSTVRYPYISHLICNAGMVSASHFDSDAMKKQMKNSFVLSMTLPLYVVHRKGERSMDGLGWVWQSNTFGHYVLVRLLHNVDLQFAHVLIVPGFRDKTPRHRENEPRAGSCSLVDFGRRHTSRLRSRRLAASGHDTDLRAF